MDEQQAILRLKNGDIGGLEILVSQYQVRAVRTAYLITRDPDLAEDIVQDAFVKVLRSIRGFDATRPFEPWFMRSVANALIGNFAWQPFEHRVGSEFQYTSQTKPADGPVTLVVENAVAYYAPLYTDPRQATPDEMSFTFDAGVNPQYGQIWGLEETFEIAGYAINVTSARAASYDDIKSPSFIDGSQGYDYGYDFSVEADPSVKMQVEMDIMSESPACWLSNSASRLPESSSIHYIQLCRGEYPTGMVRVTIRELSVLVRNTWQAVWMP